MRPALWTCFRGVRAWVGDARVAGPRNTDRHFLTVSFVGCESPPIKFGIREDVSDTSTYCQQPLSAVACSGYMLNICRFSLIASTFRSRSPQIVSKIYRSNTTYIALSQPPNPSISGEWWGHRRHRVPS